MPRDFTQAGFEAYQKVINTDATDGQTERMSVLNNGSVSIGTTSSLSVYSGRTTLSVNGTFDSMAAFGIGGTLVGYVAGAGNSEVDGETQCLHIDAQGKRSIKFATYGQARLFIQSDGHVRPAISNTASIGTASYRWTTAYLQTAVNTTSDRNYKEQIADLDDAERAVAATIRGLFKKYKLKEAVAVKGENARIHVGVIAQDVAAAFVAEGLDPHRYALFCSDTWYQGVKRITQTDFDGTERVVEEAVTAQEPFEGSIEITRLSIRYEELLAFVIAAM